LQNPKKFIAKKIDLLQKKIIFIAKKIDLLQGKIRYPPLGGHRKIKVQVKSTIIMTLPLIMTPHRKDIEK